MKTTRTLLIALSLALVSLAACDKGELKEDEKPVGDTNSAPSSAPAGDDKAPAGDDKAPVGDDKAPAGDDKAPAEAAAVDHSKLDGILKKFVNEKGKVNYKGLKADEAALGELKAYNEWVGTADISKYSRDEKLAFYINAYNALTLKAVLDRYPLKSVLDVKDPDFFKGIKHKVAGEELTLDGLENVKIRGDEFKEARIHFLVNCASGSCPKLRRDAVTAANMEALFEAGAKEYVLQETKLDAAKKTLDTSNIFNWFAEDFKKSSGTVQEFLARYMDPAQAETVKASSLTFHEYDWSLNEQKE